MIKGGKERELRLGNLEARRDWGYASDYVEAMWLMLQRDQPEDFVIATGETHSVREFVQAAFAAAGLDWHEFVRCDPAFCRPADVDMLLGDPDKAAGKLGWRPKVGFNELVEIMVEAGLKRVGDR
jgi:GDPmannose 4,6-dehydratase